MIHEFAIDPATLTCFDRVARIIDACSSGSPRLIADFPRRRWLNEVLASCESNGCFDSMLKRVEIKIDHAKKNGRLHDRGRNSPTDGPWIDRAIKEYQRLSFRAIVSTGGAASAESVLEIEEDLLTQVAWNLPRSVTVERTAKAFVDALSPLLRLSSRITIVEPYFDIGDTASTNPIRALLLESAKEMPSLTLVQLHIANKFDGMRKYLIEHSSELAKIIPNDVDAEVFLWEEGIVRGERSKSDKLHDRFLLTDVGGVQIGWGFNTKKGSYTTLTLLDDKERRDLEENISLRSNRFRPVHEEPLRVKGLLQI
jgi:hypothetical protein